MKKCDVCGKNSIFPEKFGNINVCKICFVKMYGPMWKYRSYDKHTDVENQRKKALENIKKLNVSKEVEDGINMFFDEKNVGMSKCDCCDNIVQILNKIGKNSICKECYSRINIKEWNENNYFNNSDVDKNRNKILKIADKNKFSKSIIEDINNHFDKKIQKGLFKVIDGYQDQILKIFDTCCVIITKDSFDKDTAYENYAEVLKRNKQKVNSSTETAINVVKKIATGGIVKAGIALATDAAIKSSSNTKTDKKKFKVYRGEHKIEYCDISKIEFQSVDKNEVGFVRISTINNVSTEDVVFLFNEDFIMDGVQEYMIEKIESIHKDNIQNQKQIDDSSIPDEILKYKNLLDVGAITQEEFAAKKNELLGLDIKH